MQNCGRYCSGAGDVTCHHVSTAADVMFMLWIMAYGMALISTPTNDRVVLDTNNQKIKLITIKTLFRQRFQRIDEHLFGGNSYPLSLEVENAKTKQQQSSRVT